MKHLPAAYLAALRRHGLKQAEFAAQNGLTPSELTRVAQGQFPSDKILQAFAHGWPDTATGQEIIEAHLRDECDRARFKSGVPRIETKGQDTLREDVRTVEAAVEGVPFLEQALRKLAHRLREGAPVKPSATLPPESKKVTRRTK